MCFIFFFKVYCRDCFIEIKNDRHCEVEVRIISNKKAINEIKNYFRFLFNIAVTDEYFSTYCKCNSKRLNVWFYGYRSICIDCVTKIHNSLYPNGKYLDCEQDDLQVILNSYRKK